MGTALTEEQAKLIRRYTERVYLLYDSDKAGLKATFRSGDDRLRGDCDDCWLQTRHGHSCRSAFLIDLFDDDQAERETGRKSLDLVEVGGRS